MNAEEYADHRLIIEYTEPGGPDGNMRRFLDDARNHVTAWYTPEDALSIIKACLYFDVPVGSTFSSAMLSKMVAKMQELEKGVESLRNQVAQ